MSARSVILAALIEGTPLPSKLAERLLDAHAEEVKKPSAGALRTKKWREKASQTSQRHIASRCDIRLKKSITYDDPSPEPSLLRKLVLEEDIKNLPPAERQGFQSEDGTIIFTATDIARLEAACPLVENVRGVILNLSASEWIERKIAPYDRVRAIKGKINKLQRLAAEKEQKLVTPKQRAAVHSVNMEALNREYEEREKGRTFLDDFHRKRRERHSHA